LSVHDTFCKIHAKSNDQQKNVALRGLKPEVATKNSSRPKSICAVDLELGLFEGGGWWSMILSFKVPGKHNWGCWGIRSSFSVPIKAAQKKHSHEPNGTINACTKNRNKKIINKKKRYAPRTLQLLLELVINGSNVARNQCSCSLRND
jgi:hypothetical protein